MALTYLLFEVNHPLPRIAPGVPRRSAARLISSHSRSLVAVALLWLCGWVRDLLPRSNDRIGPGLWPSAIRWDRYVRLPDRQLAGRTRHCPKAWTARRATSSSGQAA